MLWLALNDCKSLNGPLTVATVTHWLEYHGAGYPDVALMHERVRDDARFWAASAQQQELEAYLAAALIELEKSPLTNRAAKRIAAMAWQSMGAEDRVKFRDWIG